MPPIDRPDKSGDTDPKAGRELCQRIEANLRQVRQRLQEGVDFPEDEFTALWNSLLPIAKSRVKDFEDGVMRSSGLNPALIFREDLLSYLQDKFKSPKILQSYDLDRPRRRKVTNFYSWKFYWLLKEWYAGNLGKLEELKWRKDARVLRREKVRLVKKDLARLKNLDQEDGRKKKILELEEALLMYEQSGDYIRTYSMDDQDYLDRVQAKVSFGSPMEHNPDWTPEPEYEIGGPVSPATKWGDVSLKDILKTIFETVDALEEDDQMIIVLSFLYGLNDKEISSEMGCSHARVRQRKLRALQNINRRLHGEFPKLVMAAREILKMAREQELLTLTDEDMACVRDETAKKIAHLYFMEKKPLPEIAGRLRLEADRARELWMSIFQDIVDSRMIRAGVRRQAPLDWDKVGDAELDQFSEPLARYIDCLPYSMRKPHAEGRVRGEAEKKTAALFEALKTTADLLYLAYHPLEKARPDLRSLFNERVHALGLQPESVLSKLELTDAFDDILNGDRVINAEQAVKLGDALGVDPEDVFSASLATIVENAGA